MFQQMSQFQIAPTFNESDDFLGYFYTKVTLLSLFVG